MILFYVFDNSDNKVVKYEFKNSDRGIIQILCDMLAYDHNCSRCVDVVLSLMSVKYHAEYIDKNKVFVDNNGEKVLATLNESHPYAIYGLDYER